MTNINKTIEKIKNKILYICAIKHDFEGGHIKSVERFVEATDKLETFIIKALKTQEQEHQKKLEELESGINKLDEDIKYYSNKEYRANFRSEAVLLIKETFRTINKT